MKKQLALCLAFVFLASILAACTSGGGAASTASQAQTTSTSAAASTGGEADVNSDGTVNNPEAIATNPDDLVFWSLFSGGDGKYMDTIIKDYNAQASGSQVASIMLVWADYYTKLTTAVAANKGPDIGVCHVSKLPELVAQGVVVPIDSYAQDVGVKWEDFDSNIIDAVTFDSEKYAIPLDTHAHITYFNKDLLEKAGVPLNANNQIDFGGSPEGFRAVMQQLKDNLPEGVTPLSLTSKGDDPYRVWWATYFQMGGTPLVSEDGTTVTMDPQIAQEAMDFVKSLYDDGFAPMGVEDHSKYFQAGSAAIHFGGTWTTGAFESVDGFNFGAQAFPQIFGKPASWADSHVMIIPYNKNRSEEKTKEAVDFINYATSTGAITWAASGQIPSNNTVLASPEFEAMPFRSDYAEAAKTAVYPTRNENFYAIKDILIKNLDNVWNGKASSADTVQSIISEMETAIS